MIRSDGSLEVGRWVGIIVHAHSYVARLMFGFGPLSIGPHLLSPKPIMYVYY
ncbi:hypothetical protein HanXRQr2_Chr16g0752751 [Helianthus annuus]|uniref:Uncharacterized protein n=1 Tax=Helianthus annuus TaxID=4232 RepID=A0A9K3DU11_HELAN|nr:hypothetical protein HanXRQr2_Chr16g0752751 [Helianthus annuus]KAJ0821545.1 hypothetical protein HanPSC8_Chr16g0721511 [Helianthus annuus]